MSLGIYARGWGPRRAPGGDAERVALLNEARALLLAVEDERNRLAREAGLLDASHADFLPDPLGIEDHARSYSELIDNLETFARDVFPRVEKKAVEGDEKAARRLRDVTRNILQTVGGTSPFRDLADNAKQTVKTGMEELLALLENVTKLIGMGLAAYVVVQIVNLLRRR